MDEISIRSIANPGDCLASLPALKQYAQDNNRQIILYLWLNRGAYYFEGAVHPTKNAQGQNVTMNEEVFTAIRPLLLQQPFIKDVLPWRGEPYSFAFDKHLEKNIDKWNINISRLYFYIFPDISTDLSVPWLTVPDSERDLAKGKIIITRTERYNNPMVSYHFLKPHQNQILFCGLKQERDKFCVDFDLNIEWLRTDTFLEFAQAVKQCQFYISNQTSGYQLAEGQKVRRILEVCPGCPNVMPFGPNGYDFLYQLGLEYYFHKLLKETNG